MSNNSECPYCANQRIFEDALESSSGAAPPSKAVRIGSYLRHTQPLTLDTMRKAFDFKSETRGDYWLHIYTEKNLVDRLAGFTVYMLGMETERQMAFPPGPFMQTIIDRRGFGAPWFFGIYFAIRFTHKKSPVVIDIHWWHSHGRIVTMRGIPDDGAASKDLKLVNDVLKLLRTETRGDPKVNAADFVLALGKLGMDATQNAVAKEMGITARTLQRWATRNGCETWGDLKARYQPAANNVV
jgi:hypothetical protein